MRKSILALVALSVMLFSTLSFADSKQTDNKKYEIVFGGGINTPIAPSGFKDAYKLGFDGQLGVNYFITSNFALGGNVAYNRLALDKNNISSIPGNSISGGNLSLFEFDGVGKYYFRPQDTNVNFYLIGGPGIAVSKASDLKVTNSGTTTTTKFGSETDFSLTGGLGITYKMTPSWSVFAEGRYGYIFAKNSSDQFSKDPSYLPIRVGFIF